MALKKWQRELVQAYPWMRSLVGTGLLRAFRDGWSETGNASDGRQAMRAHDGYDKVFAGNLLPDGRVRMSEQAWFAYRDAVTDMFRDYGVPEGFYDKPADIGKFIEGEVSPTELQARLDQGVVAARNAPSEVIDELRRFSDKPFGALAAFFLDPDRAFEVIKADFARATIAGQSKMSGFGELTRSQAQRIFELGADPANAGKTFAELAESRELFTPLVGSDEDEISADEAIEAAFGSNSKVRGEIRRRAEERVAAFQGGGGAATSNEGIVGLGSSQN